MRYAVSIKDDKAVENVYDRDMYEPAGITLHDITVDEFQVLNGAQRFDMWVYENGSLKKAGNYDEIMNEIFNAQQAKLRQIAYIEQSDPIFMQWQRGTATKDEWIAKVDEIKQMYPYK